MSVADPYEDMAKWPYDNLANFGNGDKKTILRAAWQGTTSTIRMHPDAQSEDSNSVREDNYDDPEGWAPRINYGDVPANFTNLASNSGGAPNPSMLTHPGSFFSMTALRTKKYHSVDTAVSFYGRKVLQIENREGAYGNEVYTNNYTGVNHKAVAYNTTNNNLWYMEAWVREVDDGGGYHQPRVTMWLFGTNWVYLPGDPNPFQYIYNFSGNSVVSGGTYDNPSEGTSHYRQKQLAANGGWTKLQMVCKFNNSAIDRLSMRLDVDDGHSTDDIITRWDRMALYPITPGLGSSVTGISSNPDGMNEISYGTYAT